MKLHYFVIVLCPKTYTISEKFVIKELLRTAKLVLDDVGTGVHVSFGKPTLGFLLFLGF